MKELSDWQRSDVTKLQRKGFHGWASDLADIYREVAGLLRDAKGDAAERSAILDYQARSEGELAAHYLDVNNHDAGDGGI